MSRNQGQGKSRREKIMLFFGIGVFLVTARPLFSHASYITREIQRVTQIQQQQRLGGGGGTNAISGVGMPFGGSIISILPCINGAMYLVLGPPSPGPYIYQAGVSRSYRNGPPTHPGQWLLGMAAPGGVCTHGVDLLYGSIIIFHGSSL